MTASKLIGPKVSLGQIGIIVAILATMGPVAMKLLALPERVDRLEHVQETLTANHQLLAQNLAVLTSIVDKK